MTDQTPTEPQPKPEPQPDYTVRDRGAGISVEWTKDYPTEGTYR